MKTGSKLFVGVAVAAVAALYFGTREASADGMPAMAPSSDSDCGGASLSPSPQTSYAIGDVPLARGFQPVLFFKTRESALLCRGSSDWKVRVLRNGRWI